jgi:putative transposase
MPDHFHCLWTLPEGDGDLSTRLRLIKTFVTKRYGETFEIVRNISSLRQKRKESNLWQRRFYEEHNP